MNTKSARQRAETGISSSAEHAGKEWQEQAVTAARLFLRWNDKHWNGLEFTIEQLRTWAYNHGLAIPAEERAWGAATRRLVKEGLIAGTGLYLRAVSSHLSPKPSYRRAR